MDLASMVIAAQEAVRKHVTGEKLSRVEEGLPEYVLRVIRAIPPLTQRYRSAHLDYPLSKPRLVHQERPKQVQGFQQVVTEIAQRHGRSVKTVYRWTRDLRAMLDKNLGKPQIELRPKKTRPRDKRRPASPPASFPGCDVPSVRLPGTISARTPIGPGWGEDWDAEWILVTAPRKYAKHLRAVEGRWNPKQLGWFVERQRIWPLIEALEEDVHLVRAV